MNTIELLQKKMQGSCQCALITSDIDRRYFTQMKSSAGTLVVFADAAYLIIDFRYIEKAKKSAKGCQTLLQRSGGGLYDQINELCAKHGVSVVSVQANCMTLADAAVLSEKLDSKLDTSSALSDIITQIRIEKSTEEIQSITAAQRIAERGYEHILGFIREGRTEREIQLELDHYMLSHGAEALSFDTIALSGANTSLPHGVPCDKPVQNGEFVLLDFGAVVNGYHSDMTRTAAVGQPNEKMRAVYDTVLKAQLAALDKARAGITGAELDAAARDVIKNAGYGECFGHSLGHGVGMEIHEPPNASQNSKITLTEGMTVTVEPGIYIEGEFGVRIEDLVVIKKDGCANITKAVKELIVI